MKSYIVSLMFFMVSCDSNDWNQTDQENFKKDCIVEGGSILICNCILECIEKEYTNYQEALKKIQHSRVSEYLKKCLTRCNEQAN